MVEERCDYYSHIIIEDAKADERIQPMETEAEMMLKKLWMMDVEGGKPREAWWIFEKRMEMRKGPNTGRREPEKWKNKKQKCFKERRLWGKKLNAIAWAQLLSIPSMDFLIFFPQPISIKIRFSLVEKYKIWNTLQISRRKLPMLERSPNPPIHWKKGKATRVF